MAAPRSSYVKRARISAGSGRYLLSVGIALFAVGVFLGPVHLATFVVMALAAPALQLPRQQAWLTQNDLMEMLSLAAMPLLLVGLSLAWLKPTGALSVAVILQGLGGFFAALGVFHIVTKTHTLRLADRIEAQE